MHRIPINHSRICDSPYCESNCQSFVFNDESIVVDLSKEIVLGNPTSILVSGYRGVGKTSFLGKLQDEINKLVKDKALFVNLNVTKYDKYANLLRQIIRQIYLALEQSKKIHKLKNKDEIKLLYTRTYSDIQQNSKYTIGSDISITSSIDMNAKLLFGSFGAMFTTGILSYYPPLKDWLLANLSFVPFGLSTLWASFELFKLKTEMSKKISASNDIQTKTLYDDEIAEYLLLNILKSIRQDEIKLIFFFDELDKLSDDNINTLICDLKPVMLSGQATFVLVSGQNLYYKYDTSHTFDDEIVASIFSKIVHIPLFSINDFIKLFNNLTNNSIQNNDIITKYIYSKILQSNRLPRRFLNLLRQDLTWDNELAFIQVNDDDMPAINTDYKLLNIIIAIEATITSKAGIKDFFITQLHMWVLRIKLKGVSKFHRNDIFGEYKQTYAIWYTYELERLLTLLLESMEQEKLLDKISETDNTTQITEIYYKWKNEIIVDFDVYEEMADIEEKIIFNYLQEFISLEQLLKITTRDLSDKLFPTMSYSKMINVLIDAKFLTTEISTLKSIIETRNKLVHEKAFISDQLYVTSLIEQMKVIKNNIAEKYIYFITKNYLTAIEPSYHLHSQYSINTKKFDIYAASDKTNLNFVFEVSTSRKFNPLTISPIITHLTAWLKQQYFTTDKNYYVILVTFFSNTKELDHYARYLENLSNIGQFDKSILPCNIRQEGDFKNFLHETISPFIVSSD